MEDFNVGGFMIVFGRIFLGLEGKSLEDSDFGKG
jgi:hypothetical protein